MDHSYWKEQLYKYRTHSLTSAEEERLWDALADPANAEDWKEIMGSMFREQPMTADYNADDWESMLQAVFDSDRTPKPAVIRRIPIVRRFAVAAVFIATLGSAVWWIIEYRSAMEPPVVQATQSVDVAAPATNRAMITLGNGQKVYLDSAGNGALARQGNAQVVKEADGQVAYKVGNITNRELLFNTLTNPRGSEVVNLTLSDGTKVWLNAESSVRYPVVFTGQDRTVDISGEGYFEVAKDAARPFHVKVNQLVITVLGTHFNINAYNDEPSVNTTLLEGLVSIDEGDHHQMILPGQDARVDKNGQTKIIAGLDTSEVMAWKNGYFQFNHADLPGVMRQIARWYDVTVEYKGPVPDMKFTGKISRNSNASDILKILEESEVHFTVEGKKIIVR